MDNPFQFFFEGCISGTTFLESLAHQSDRSQVIQDIRKWLKKSVEEQKWHQVQFLVLAAQKYPSKEFTEVLSCLLKECFEDVNNEDIVDLMDMIADPSAIDALLDVVDRELAGDDFHKFNEKCVMTIDKLTGKSNAEMVCLKNSPIPEVRSLAQSLLG